MSSKRDDGQFLGTEDIVRRLRRTQGHVFGGSWWRTGAVLAVGAMVGGGVAMTVWRGWSPAAPVADAAAEGAAAHLSSLAPATAGRGEGHLAPVLGRDGAAHSVSGLLIVRLLHAPRGASLAIDGVTMGQVEVWQGALPRGRHTLTVRLGRRQQEHVVLVHNGAQEVVVDLQARRIHARNLHGAYKGH